jgi:phage head maturation protease
METLDLLRARRSSAWSRVKLLDNDKMSYSVEGKPTLDIGRMTLEYCLTSPVIDREGDLILPDAPDWTDHKRNPLTLFNHKLDQPFGKSEDTTGRYTVERRGDRWYGKSYLFQNDPFAEEVYRLAEKGALNGASIGFLPAKPPFGASTVKHMNGYDYTVIESCKVFEWSAVYIPMNQDALLVAAEVVRKGLGNKPLSDRAMAMFSPYVPEVPVWSNGWTAKGAGWEESAHPRGDDGKFISGSDISAAAGDKNKEAELRKRVTDPKQIQRLNVALTTEPNKSKDDYGEKHNKLEGDKLGQGSTGDVYRVGNTAVKKASKAESQVYKEMSNVDGIAHGVTHGDQIVTPYFKNIVSIDTIKDKDRKGMAPIIAKAYPTLVNALTHLSEAGFDYNDDLQVGFDEKRNPNIFDFSITAKTSPEEATRENLDRFSSYLKTFGCDKLADNVSTVSMVRFAMGDLDNSLMEDDEEYKVAAKLSKQLDGKEAKYFYYSNNARTIPNAAQTEQYKGIKIIASDKPLTDKFMKDWEISPVIHKNGQSSEKSFAPTQRSNPFAHKFSGIIKMYDEKSEVEQPVDPIAANVEGEAPSTPLGAQFIAGVHEIAMTAAKFYTDNVSQLEPELVGEFTKLEKIIMGAVASMAQMFNSRYQDLPPLDGADWIDPDQDGDIDLTEDPELNPDAEEDKAMAEDAIGEESADGEVGEVEVDGEESEADIAVDDESIAEEDDGEDEEDKPKFGKAFVDSAKSKLKVLLDSWVAKQKALKEAAKKIEHPDAIHAVKAASHFLRTIAGDPREDKAMRSRAKKLRSDLVNTLPKVKSKAMVVIPVAPSVPDIDLDKIANHFNSTKKALEVNAAALEEKLAKLLQLTGK